MKQAALILLFFLSLLPRAEAQKGNDDQLAQYYYERKEYDKAVVYFDKLYDKAPDTYYANYFKCLVELKDYSKAEKITKKQLKRNEGSVYLYVRLGKLYQLQGNTEKEKEQYNKALKELPPEQSAIFSLAHSFEEVELYD
jgi:tetratricopeptide (TPR) repeat protein